MADAVKATNKGGGSFQRHPEGMHAGRCVDVIDLGWRVKTFQGKSSIKSVCALVFATGERNDQGELITISREFTLSSHEKAGLRLFMERWRGKPYTDEEAEEIDIGKMEGVPALLNIVHGKSKAGRDYATVESAVRLPPKMKDDAPTMEALAYKRGDWWAKTRERYAEEVEQHKAQSAGAPAEDEDYSQELQEPSEDGDAPPF